MPRVKVLVPHAKAQGIGIWRRGESYDETPLAAEQKVAAKFVEYEDGSVPRTKEDPDMYRTRSFSVPAQADEGPGVETRDGLELVEHTGNWYTFSDGEKVLGKRAAASHLGVTVEELEALDVDSA